MRTPEMQRRVDLYDELVEAVKRSVTSAASETRTVRDPDDAARYVANTLTAWPDGYDLLRRLADAFATTPSDEPEEAR